MIEPFNWYYRYRGCVDNNNQKRHFPCSFEEAWKTTKWSNCVFAFIISVAEVNAYQIAHYKFGFPMEETTIQLRKQLARELIENTFDLGVQGRQAWKNNCFNDDHRLVTAPNYAMKWLGHEWQKSEKQKYPQRCCATRGCKKRVRTYCSCSIGVWKCAEHYAHHLLSCLESNK